MSKVAKTKFKETEIGAIPEEWDVKSLDLVADIIGGGTPKTTNKEYWNGDIPWLSVVDFGDDNKFVYQTEKNITQTGFENSSTKILEKDMLILSARGTVGEIAQLGRPMAFNQSCYGLNAKQELSNNFLYYILKKSVSDFKLKSHGAVFDTITRDTFKNIYVPIPPKHEQEQIAEILSCLDDKIELNRKINDNLEKVASSLFKHWFVDFEFPNKEGKPYKSSGGKMIDSESGEIPEGWKVGKISNLIKVESGFSFNSNMFDESGQYKLVTIKNVQNGYFVNECTNSLSIIPEKMPRCCNLKNGDILLSLTGNVGRVCIVNGKNYLLNQRVATIIPIDEKNRAFAYLLFRQKDFQYTLMNISHGTAQQNLSPIETSFLEIFIPSIEILNHFAEVANPIFENIVSNLNQAKYLSSIRDSILPRLMSGKIRV